MNIPPPDDVTAGWWDATREHRYTLQTCGSSPRRAWASWARGRWWAIGHRVAVHWLDLADGRALPLFHRAP